VESVDYARGRQADIFGEPGQKTILFWHGAQTDARASVRPLAQLLAAHGLAVIAPDWNSRAPDGGRSDLLGSIEFTQAWSAHPDKVVVAGWSLGGAAAAALAIRGQSYLPVAHAVCLAGAFMVADPIFGERLSAEASDGDGRAPFTLIHGDRDDVIPAAASRAFAALLQRAGWPVTLVELETDHAAIAGAAYDSASGRYVPASDDESLSVAADVAAHIAAAIAGGSASE
jgi:dienelactone hydrolase